MSYRLAGEFDDHYMLAHPDGKPFLLPKKGLSADTHAKVKALPILKMSAGGVMPTIPGATDPIDGGSSSMPAPEPTADPTAEIPTMTPIQKQIQDQKDFLQYSNPNVYAAIPDQLDKDAQNAVMDQAQHKFNSDNAASIAAAEHDAKTKADDTAYNERAAKLGLPLRTIAADSAAPGANHMTNASVDMSTGAGGAPNAGPPMMNGQLPGAYGQAFDGAQSGIEGMEKAAQAQGAQVTSALQSQMAQEAKANALHTQNMNNLMNENHNLTDQYMNGKLDPNRVWNNMGTGNKIGAAIAIALGGLAGGGSGKNAALDVMNGAIDRDLESQKADMGKTQNLLTMNMQKYKNENDAYAMTKAQIISATQAKIGLAATQMGTATAMNAAKMQVSQLQLQKAQLFQEVSKNMTMAELNGAGTGQGGIPTNQLSPSMLADPKFTERSIDVNGRTYVAKSPKDAEELRNAQADYQPVKDMVKQLSQIGPMGAVKGTQEYNRAVAIKSFLIPAINKLHGLNRLSEPDIELMQKQLGDANSFSQMLSGSNKVVNDQFSKNIDDQMEESYKTRLTGYNRLHTVMK